MITGPFAITAGAAFGFFMLSNPVLRGLCLALGILIVGLAAWTSFTDPDHRQLIWFHLAAATFFGFVGHSVRKWWDQT